MWHSCLSRYLWRRNNIPWGIEAALLFANLPIQENSSSQIGKWKRQCLANERWERIHQISFTVPSTLISHWSWTLYILKLGGVNWLVTNQNSWIPYSYTNSTSFILMSMFYIAKSNFLISIQYKTYMKKWGTYAA